MADIPARHEGARKGIHLVLSLVAAGVVAWLPAMHAATVLAGATFVALSVELARRTSVAFGSAFQRLAPLLRDVEERGLTGATTLSVGYTAAALLFPGLPALIGILVAGVADAAAAVVGKRFGRLRYPGGKSAEGSVTFALIVAALLLLMLPGATVSSVLLPVLGLTLLEALTLPIADNLYLPVAAALSVRLVSAPVALTFFP
ncbi:MAG: hypothetical protein ACLFRX_00265 [Gemmatimonadota bacterium]